MIMFRLIGTKGIIFLATSIFFIPAFSHGAGNGEALQRSCIAADSAISGAHSENPTQAAYCLGLIKGVKDTMLILGNDSLNLCFPESGISAGQSVKVVLSYLNDNPQLINEGDAVLALLAFKNAFQCTE